MSPASPEPDQPEDPECPQAGGGLAFEIAPGGDMWQPPASEGAPPEGPEGRKNGRVSARPGDWHVQRDGFDAAAAAGIATKSLRDVFGRFSEEGTLSPEQDIWTQVAGAEIAAVGHGRKPLFHEEVMEPAMAMAAELAHHFPRLHIEAWEGHLTVADPEQLARLGTGIDDVWQAVGSDHVGVLLGYGVAHWQQGTARVAFFSGDGTPLAGFWTLAEWAEEFAIERAQDYEAVFEGVYFEITLREAKKS